jgi:hypothetical protein
MKRDSLRFAVTMLGRPQDAVVAYVNAHDSAPTPEFAVYGDEWRMAPFGDREGDDESRDEEIDVTPSASFRDYALWHLDRMLATGAVDGFFFDNTFLRASFDERHGSAWRDARGELQPGVDLFAVRELLRRAQTLVWERRGQWWNVAHATTTPISAIQGWAGFLLDGEWRYGAEPHTRRFPRDLVRASSLGTQLGAVPVYLPGIIGVTGDREAALRRNLGGFAALHEIRVMDNLSGAPGEFARRLLAFGYADPACSVHRYWDGPPAFTLTGADAEALVVRCGEDALALVVGFGAGARVELRLDAARLGLPAKGRCSDPEGLGGVETLADGCRLTLVEDDVRWVSWRGTR